MTRPRKGQANGRSASTRAREMAAPTVITTTLVVENALRSPIAPGNPGEAAGLLRQGRILVIPAGGRVLSLEEADVELEAVRNGE